ncbi:MAG: DUF1194 domain-containing protein [Sphingomonadaceae bacterium]
MKKLLLTALGATSALAMSAPASAATIELALALDASGSIGSSDFNLQRQAYINALSDTSILPQDGTIAIGIYRFASTTTTIFSMAEITSGNFSALITALTNMAYTGGGTNIGSAINTATADIFGNGVTSNRQIIDVSTDGFGTMGTSVADALGAGVDQINCIGIGGGADCSNVVGGTGSFSMTASNFAAFESSLRTKLKREITGGAVPEPATWLMLILGFGAVGGALRASRRQKAKLNFA